MNDYELASSWIKSADNIVVVPHYNADGDAVGSSLGMYLLLQNIGKNVKVVYPNDFPSFLKWMKGADEIIIAEKDIQIAELTIAGADLIIMTDFNSLGRIDLLGNPVSKSKARKIVIDHHPNPDDFADLLFSDTSVSSAAELVFQFIGKVGLKHAVDKFVAECIFTGIMTDTGSFSFNSSRPETYQIVSELLGFGINKDEIYSQVFDNYSENRFRLLGYCLNNKMNVLPAFSTGYISISKKELEQFNFEPGDTEGFVNYPLSIKGIVFSAIFIEKEDHIKISFRSKGDFAVNDFARNYFNGGGHHNASAGKSELGMEETIIKFHELLMKHSDSLSKK